MTRGLRVVVLHSSYASGMISGENRVVLDEVRLLREHGHTVVDWLPSVPSSSLTSASRAAASAVWSFSAAAHVRELVRTSRADLVHVHNLYPNLSPSVLRSVDVPVVMTLHNYRMHCLPGTFLRDGRVCEKCLGASPLPGIRHRCYRSSASASTVMATSLMVHRAAHSFENVTRFAAVSHFLGRKHVSAGLPSSRLVVKPNFSWPTRRRVGPGRYFLFLGRLTEEKGLRTLIESWRRVRATCIIAGEGALREELERIASPNVRFLGSINPHEVDELLRDARALIVPSIWYEGHPRAILEALAAGVPVIASDIGGLPEVVRSDVTGILVPPGDVDALTRAAERLLSDPVSQVFGEGAYESWRSDYTPTSGLHNLEALYGAALATA